MRMFMRGGEGKMRLAGWPRGMHTHLSAVLPGFESQPSYKLSFQRFTSRVIHQCVSFLKWMLNWHPVCRHQLEVKQQRVICEEKVSDHQNHGQVPNSCPNYCWEGDGKPHSRTLSNKLLRQNRRSVTECGTSESEKARCFHPSHHLVQGKRGEWRLILPFSPPSVSGEVTEDYISREISWFGQESLIPPVHTHVDLCFSPLSPDQWKYYLCKLRMFPIKTWDTSEVIFEFTQGGGTRKDVERDYAWWLLWC